MKGPLKCLTRPTLSAAHCSLGEVVDPLAALAFVLKPVISGTSSRGSALQKRLRDREKEMEADERDRKREKEELEEIRQRLLDEGHPNPDAELRRVRLSKMTVCVCLCASARSVFICSIHQP